MKKKGRRQHLHSSAEKREDSEIRSMARSARRLRGTDRPFLLETSLGRHRRQSLSPITRLTAALALEPGCFQLGRLLHDEHVVGRGRALGLVRLGLFRASLPSLFVGWGLVVVGAGDRELHTADALEERARGRVLSGVFQLRGEQGVKGRGLLRRPGERGVGGGHGEKRGRETGKGGRKKS